MRADELTTEIAALLASGARLVVVRTDELSRGLHALRSAAERLGTPFCAAASFDEAAAARLLRETAGPVVLWGPDAGDWGAPLLEAVCARDHTNAVVSLQLSERVPAVLSRVARVVSLDLPTKTELAVVFREEALAWPQADPDAEEWAVRALRGLGEEQARLALRAALRRSPADGRALGQELHKEKAAVLRGIFGLDWVEPSTRLEQVGGLDGFKMWAGQWARALEPAAEAFGIEPPRGALLVGVQGCGKSLCAKAVAPFWGLPLARLDLPLVLGAAGAPEEALARILGVVEALAPVVVWVDELDKSFRGQSSATASSTTRALGLFMTWMAERTAAVPVVATANTVLDLPPELLRKGRFDELFFFDLPSRRERLEVFRIHLSAVGRDPAAFDLERVVERSEHYSGAEIGQIVQAALREAFLEGAPLGTTHLLLALDESPPLYWTSESSIRTLREWAQGKARPATPSDKLLELFSKGG
jgi:SpoVK/Ycf46/Vps4 family AAA+-type ATPase